MISVLLWQVSKCVSCPSDLMAIRPPVVFRPLPYSLPHHIPTRKRSLVSLSTMSKLSVNDLNPAIRNVQYAVRGELAIKAEQYRVRLQQNPTASGLPFSQVISSNIGNPQQKGLDQPPLTFVRQVWLSLSPFFVVAQCAEPLAVSLLTSPRRLPR